jgi:mono/diheme cytochrome c family protein
MRTLEEAGVRRIVSRWLLACAVLTSLTALGVSAQGNPDAARIKNPVAAAPDSIAAGKAIYQRYCATCHGLNAEGGSGSDISPPAPDLTDTEWKRGSTDGEIFSVIKNGVPPELNMEPWGDRIKDADIWNVVNYVRSLAKNK